MHFVESRGFEFLSESKFIILQSKCFITFYKINARMLTEVAVYILNACWSNELRPSDAIRLLSIVTHQYEFFSSCSLIQTKRGSIKSSPSIAIFCATSSQIVTRKYICTYYTGWPLKDWMMLNKNYFYKQVF